MRFGLYGSLTCTLGITKMFWGCDARILECVDVMVALDFVSLEKVNTILGRNNVVIPW